MQEAQLLSVVSGVRSVLHMPSTCQEHQIQCLHQIADNFRKMLQPCATRRMMCLKGTKTKLHNVLELWRLQSRCSLVQTLTFLETMQEAQLLSEWSSKRVAHANSIKFNVCIRFGKGQGIHFKTRGFACLFSVDRVADQEVSRVVSL